MWFLLELFLFLHLFLFLEPVWELVGWLLVHLQLLVAVWHGVSTILVGSFLLHLVVGCWRLCLARPRWVLLEVPGVLVGLVWVVEVVVVRGGVVWGS